MRGFVMRLRKASIGAFLAVIAVLGPMALPALAGSRGARDYIWPAHCNTDILLDIHTIGGITMDHASGRARLTSCGGSAGTTAVSVQYMKLWKHSSTDPTPVQIADLGVPVPLLMAGNFWTLETDSRGCLHKVGDPGGILKGDSVWTEMKYKIEWGDGTYTIMRDDNSLAFTFTLASQCQ
jgi:hypothetical protein